MVGAATSESWMPLILPSFLSSRRAVMVDSMGIRGSTLHGPKMSMVFLPERMERALETAERMCAGEQSRTMGENDLMPVLMQRVTLGASSGCWVK